MHCNAVSFSQETRCSVSSSTRQGMLLLQYLCQGATQQRGCRGQPHIHDFTVAVCTGALGCWSCRGSPCSGGPPGPTRPCRFGSGASCSGITGLGVRGKKIPQCPEPMPHGPQSCAGCTQLSPRTPAPGRMLQRQRPEQNPGHAGTMT